MEVTDMSKEELQKMQKEMGPYYLLQLVVTIISTFMLAGFVKYFSLAGIDAYTVALWVWFGFITPTQISAVIWGNTKKKFWAKQIFVMISYQLVAAIITAFIFTNL
jgi:hypothetical protein